MLIGETPIGSLPGVGDSYIVRTKTYDMDQWTIFTGSEPLGGGEIRYYLNRNYGACISKSDILDVAMFYGTSIIKNTDYQIITSLKDTLRGIDISMSLVPTYELTIPSTSVINTLVWSWAEAFDSVWRKMDTMKNALKIEHADGTYLDDAWGQIYDLPRIYEEDDTSYRDRLKTRTTILTSSGTKANCETIIDSITGEFGTTTVTTQYPSSVRITFSTIEAMRKARIKQTVLNYLIPEMLAAGVTYNLCLPFLDYYIDTYLMGPLTLSHTMVYALSHHNEDTPYNMNIINNIQSTISYSPDVQLMDVYNMPFLVGSIFITNKIKQFLMNTKLFGTETKSVLFDIVNKKQNITKNIVVDGYITRYDIEKSFAMTSRSKTELRRIYRMANIIVNQLTMEYTIDMLLRLFSKSLATDILTKRSFPKRHNMTIKIVGA